MSSLFDSYQTQWQMFQMVSGHQMLVPLSGVPWHGDSIQRSTNLGKSFLRISCTWKTAPIWILARVFAYLPPFISQIRDFIYWAVLIFITSILKLLVILAIWLTLSDVTFPRVFNKYLFEKHTLRGRSDMLRLPYSFNCDIRHIFITRLPPLRTWMNLPAAFFLTSTWWPVLFNGGSLLRGQMWHTSVANFISFTLISPRYPAYSDKPFIAQPHARFTKRHIIQAIK